MAKIVFVLFLVHVVSAEGVGLDDPLPPFVVFDSGETNFTVPVDAVSESATDARGTDGAADEQALEERKNSTDGSREKDVIFPVTVNETITDVRAVVGDQLQCVECDGYYPCIFNRQIVACKSANATGCTTTYGNANKDGVIAMGCFEPKDNEERFASSCVTYEDGRFVCSCIGNVCNLAYVQSPSFTEGGLICWQCDGDEECNKRELDKIMTCDRRVYSSCLTVFETVEGGLICWQCDGDEECNKRELDKIMTCDRRVYSSCLTVFETVEEVLDGICRFFRTSALVDVTIVCGGYQLHAHRLVLAACSPYFEELFRNFPPDQARLVIALHNIEWDALRLAIEYIYKGETQVPADKLDVFLEVARLLEIKDLRSGVEKPNMNAAPPIHSQASSQIPKVEQPVEFDGEMDQSASANFSQQEPRDAKAAPRNGIPNHVEQATPLRPPDYPVACPATFNPKGPFERQNDWIWMGRFTTNEPAYFCTGCAAMSVNRSVMIRHSELHMTKQS
ncbi:unnamed protein product [Notodromas monacha]|uniref:BTB domain-containing protein n=1 Tax=Notodromas monacha TaxID=399045 RepID=A0A7R9BNZ1_9CRUS|nr:unnamed protein product [Notodromas monacha]CAG0917910.1 unnamed protein product [Notodromas monacha]